MTAEEAAKTGGQDRYFVQHGLLPKFSEEFDHLFCDF